MGGQKQTRREFHSDLAPIATELGVKMRENRQLTRSLKVQKGWFAENAPTPNPPEERGLPKIDILEHHDGFLGGVFRMFFSEVYFLGVVYWGTEVVF